MSIPTAKEALVGQFWQKLGGGLEKLGNFVPGLGLIGGAIGGIANLRSQHQNREMEMDLFNRQVGLSNTEVQRRTMDMRAAGISPTLAAGGGAATPSAPSLSAPQYNVGAATDQALKLQSMKEIRARTKNIDEQTEGIKIENLWKDPTKREELRGLIITNTLKEDFAPAQMRQLQANIKNTDARTRNVHLDSALKEQGWDLQTVELAIARHREEIMAATGMRQAEADVLMKEVLERTARYSLEKWEIAGLPPGTNINPFSMAEFSISERLRQAEAVLKAFGGLFRRREK